MVIRRLIGGLLELRLQAERRNTIKVLLLIDVGGSMDPHARLCELTLSLAALHVRARCAR